MRPVLTAILAACVATATLVPVTADAADTAQQAPVRARSARRWVLGVTGAALVATGLHIHQMPRHEPTWTNQAKTAVVLSDGPASLEVDRRTEMGLLGRFFPLTSDRIRLRHSNGGLELMPYWEGRTISGVHMSNGGRTLQYLVTDSERTGLVTLHQRSYWSTSGPHSLAVRPGVPVILESEGPLSYASGEIPYWMTQLANPSPAGN